MPSQPDSAKPRIIRKYANRRLYDTETSQSITLNDVRDLIGSGLQVQVVEAKTGNDVTRTTLLQIVADQELMGQPALSDEVLTAIIRMNSNPLRDLARNFFEQGVRQLESQHSELRTAWREGLKKAGLDSMADLSTLPLDSLTRLQREVMEVWTAAVRKTAREHPDHDPARKRSTDN